MTKEELFQAWCKENPPPYSRRPEMFEAFYAGFEKGFDTGFMVRTEKDRCNELLDAVKNLRNQKGRHNTEIAYDKLMNVLKEIE